MTGKQAPIRQLFCLLLLLCASATTFAQWTILPTPGNPNLNKVHFFNPSHGIVAGDQFGFTTDGGANWSFAPVPITVTDLQMTGLQTAYICGYDTNGAGFLLRTNDLGLTWTTEIGPLAATRINGCAFHSSGRGIVVGDYGMVQTQFAPGSGWISIAPSQSDHLTALAMPDANTAYATTTTGMVYRTTNAGMSWPLYSGGASAYFEAVDFLTVDEGIAVGAGNAINVSQRLTALVPGNPISGTTAIFGGLDVVMVSLNKFFQTTGEPHLWHSSDGLNWMRILVPGLSNSSSIRGVHFPSSQTGYAVGNNGLILKTTTGGACTPSPRAIRSNICLGDSLKWTADASWTNFQWRDSASNVVFATTAHHAMVPTGNMTVYFEASHPVCGLFRDTLRTQVHYCDSVWPGDANADGVANMADFLLISYFIASGGPPRPAASNAWTAQYAADWGPLFFQVVDKKHLDCDGNGLVNLADTIPLSLNYGLTHSKTNASSSTGIPFVLEAMFDSLAIGDTGYVRVLLGDQTHPVQGLHGIAFSFNYDPTLIDTNSVSVSFDTTWISPTNNAGLGMTKDFYYQGRTDIGYAHTNQLNSSGYGMVAGITFVTIDNISGKTQGASQVLEMSLSNPLAYDGNLNLIAIATPNSAVTTHIVDREAISPFVPPFKVYPNPSRDVFYLDADGHSIGTIQLFDLYGKSLWQGANVAQLDISAFPEGIYFLEVTVDQEQVTCKIQVQK